MAQLLLQLHLLRRLVERREPCRRGVGRPSQLAGAQHDGQRRGGNARWWLCVWCDSFHSSLHLTYPQMQGFRTTPPPGDFPSTRRPHVLTHLGSLSWQDSEHLAAIAAERLCPPAAAALRFERILAAAQPHHAGGFAIFLLGSLQQARCHSILRSLRLQGSHVTGAQRYGVPRGGWFESVSSAHYLAEIVLYAGLLVTSGPSCVMVRAFIMVLHARARLRRHLSARRCCRFLQLWLRTFTLLRGSPMRGICSSSRCASATAGPHMSHPHAGLSALPHGALAKSRMGEQPAATQSLTSCS